MHTSEAPVLSTLCYGTKADICCPDLPNSLATIPHFESTLCEAACSTPRGMNFRMLYLGLCSENRQ